MDLEQLNTDLSALGSVGTCEVVNNELRISINIEGMKQSHINDYHDIVAAQILGTYSNIDVEVFEVDTIKAIYKK